MSKTLMERDEIINAHGHKWPGAANEKAVWVADRVGKGLDDKAIAQRAGRGVGWAAGYRRLAKELGYLS